MPLEQKLGRDFPPPIAHAEYYYGFLGVATAWQVAFLILATDPVRFRPMMIPAILEKVSFGVAAVLLFLSSRLSLLMFAAGLFDLLLAILFCVAFVRTPRAAGEVGSDSP